MKIIQNMTEQRPLVNEHEASCVKFMYYPLAIADEYAMCGRAFDFMVFCIGGYKHWVVYAPSVPTGLTENKTINSLMQRQKSDKIFDRNVKQSMGHPKKKRYN